jgi:hypothetical protein
LPFHLSGKHWLSPLPPQDLTKMSLRLVWPSDTTIQNLFSHFQKSPIHFSSWLLSCSGLIFYSCLFSFSPPTEMCKTRKGFVSAWNAVLFLNKV